MVSSVGDSEQSRTSSSTAMVPETESERATATTSTSKTKATTTATAGPGPSSVYLGNIHSVDLTRHNPDLRSWAPGAGRTPPTPDRWNFVQDDMINNSDVSNRRYHTGNKYLMSVAREEYRRKQPRVRTQLFVFIPASMSGHMLINRHAFRHELKPYNCFFPI